MLLLSYIRMGIYLFWESICFPCGNIYSRTRCFYPYTRTEHWSALSGLLIWSMLSQPFLSVVSLKNEFNRFWEYEAPETWSIYFCCSEKQLSSQSKYSFKPLFVIIYANLCTRIFGVNFLTTWKKYYTVEAPLTDTLVSGQLYLRPPSQNPDLFNSHTNSVFSHSRKRPAPVTDTFFAPRGCPLTRASTVVLLRFEKPFKKDVLWFEA